MYPIFALLIFICLLVLQGAWGNNTETEKGNNSSLVSFAILQRNGGRVSWSHALNLIAFDKAGKDGYFDVYTIYPDGCELRCLTRTRKKHLPQSNNGQPAWHPAGDYIVFQAQDPSLKGFSGRRAEFEKYLTSPGIGINNNLWLMTADGSKFWQLTSVEDHHGVLHPHFSPDGTMLLWSEIISADLDRIGRWAIKLADFAIVDGKPRLSNIQTLQPRSLQFYETHGFSPDGKKIIFSGIEEGKYYYDMEIYLMDLFTVRVTRLTYNYEWDEHAHFTPDGQHIVWVSSKDIPQRKRNPILSSPKLEYWVMNPDGSGKRRLTYFNDPFAAEYMSGGAGVADFDWGLDGKTIVAKMRKGRRPSKELTVLMEFDLESY